MNEETMNMNEELIEVTEEVKTSKAGKAAKVVVIGGLTLLAGKIIYKRVIKPIASKIKAKKQPQVEAVEEIEEDDDMRIFDDNGNPIEK